MSSKGFARYRNSILAGSKYSFREAFGNDWRHMVLELEKRLPRLT